MTDIVLVQPPIRDFYRTAKRTIPYGLASIAAVLVKAGFSVEILDALATPKSHVIDMPPEFSYLSAYYGQPDRSPFALFHDFKHFGYSFEYIGKTAKASRAFLIGISSLFSPYVQEAIITAETIKAYLPTCKIVLGGHHPTALPQTVMQSAAIDFILRGEGEVSIALLAKAVRDGGNYDEIPGLVYRRADGTIRISEPALMQDPEQYPLPAIHLVKNSFYSRNKRASAVIVGSRGCPMKCTYCSVGASTYLKFRQRKITSIIAEIEAAVKTQRAGFIDFEDENLSLNRRWFLSLMGAIKTRFGNCGLEFRAMNGLFPPSLDEEVVAAMRDAGFTTLNLSLGSFSKNQLEKFQRPDVRNAFDQVLDLAEKFGLSAVGYIIIGAPFQDAECSISDLLHLAARRVLAGISVFYPSPGSPDYESCAAAGILPERLACLRSSALPLSHATSRLESATLLRLGRILNFMKLLIDRKHALPDPTAPESEINGCGDRIAIGKKLLQYFLHDGKIRGISPGGEIFEHKISAHLTEKFINGLQTLTIRGTI
jgi:radical SAM superfamily enzyme YgiQ (UPF0313 family)